MEEQCGDYEVESGEECDAGLLGQLGNDPCCNSSCKLTEGALCRCEGVRVCRCDSVRGDGVRSVTAGCSSIWSNLFKLVVLLVSLDLSDINDICCEDCGYAPPTVVCRSFPGGNRDCLDAVNCTGDAKDCPSVTNFVAVGTECGLGYALDFADLQCGHST